MSAVQTAAANVMFGIANQFRENCAFKQGLPTMPIAERIGEEQPAENVTISRTETATANTVTESPSPGEGAAAVTPSPLWRRAAPLIVSAAVGAGVPLLTLLRPTTPTAPPAPAPIVQPAEQTQDGSLLQYLQDKGYHLPGGEQWPTNLK